MSSVATQTTDERVRLDVWLWRARFFKTRTEAGRFVAEGKVRLERGGSVRRVEKPAALVTIGDRLIFARQDRIVSLVVLAFGHRRGPPSEARSLYSDITLEQG
jgi:ribosomal 50S subunit-recycling heat shock protein